MENTEQKRRLGRVGRVWQNEKIYKVGRTQSFGVESEFQELVYSGGCECQVMMMKTTNDQRPDDAAVKTLPTLAGHKADADDAFRVLPFPPRSPCLKRQRPWIVILDLDARNIHSLQTFSTYVNQSMLLSAGPPVQLQQSRVLAWLLCCPVFVLCLWNQQGYKYLRLALRRQARAVPP
jgi:hypothetical protein